MWKQLMQTCINYNAFNAMYVDAKDIHIFFAHNFLDFQQIFNPIKVLESWDLGCLGSVAVMTLACTVRDLGLIPFEALTF